MKFPLVGRRLVAALLSTSCGLLSCGPPPPAKVAVKAEPLAASDLLPSDLDFVFRIDSGRVRANPMFTGAFREVASGEGSAGSSGLVRAILPLLEQSRSLTAGGKFMSDGFRGDGVVAIELAATSERARELPFDGEPFRWIPGAPAGIEVLERTVGRREDVAVEVILEHGIVLATLGEADAVLRLVRSGPDADRLDPPARGLVSFAGRLRGAGLSGLPGGDGMLRRIAEGVARFSGTLDASEGFRIEAELFYRDAPSATRGDERAREVLGRLKGMTPPYVELSDSAKLTRTGEMLRITATAPFALFRSMR